MCLHDHDLADASFYELRWCTNCFVHTGIDNEPLSGNVVCRTFIVYAGVKYERNYLFFNSCFELAVFFISYTNWFIPLAEENSPGNWLVGKVVVSKLHVNSSYALYLQTSADLKTWIYSWFALDDQVGGFAFGSSCEFCPAILSSRWKIYSFEFLLQITCCA